MLFLLDHAFLCRNLNTSKNPPTWAKCGLSFAVNTSEYDTMNFCLLSINNLYLPTHPSFMKRLLCQRIWCNFRYYRIMDECCVWTKDVILNVLWQRCMISTKDWNILEWVIFFPTFFGKGTKVCSPSIGFPPVASEKMRLNGHHHHHDITQSITTHFNHNYSLLYSFSRPHGLMSHCWLCMADTFLQRCIHTTSITHYKRKMT